MKSYCDHFSEVTVTTSNCMPTLLYCVSETAVSIWCKCPEMCMISNSRLCMSMQSSTVPSVPSVPHKV